MAGEWVWLLLLCPLGGIFRRVWQKLSDQHACNQGCENRAIDREQKTQPRPADALPEVVANDSAETGAHHADCVDGETSAVQGCLGCVNTTVDMPYVAIPGP